VPITLGHRSFREIPSLSVSLLIVDSGCGDTDMDDGVRGERGVDKGRNISRGFWGGGLHLPLSLDVSVSMEHSEGLLGTNRGVDTSRNIVLGMIPRACVLVGLVLCANFEAPWIIHGRSCGGDQPVLLVLTEKIL